MEGLLGASRHALLLLLSGDYDLWTTIAISFSVSLKAIVLTAPVALVLAFVLAHTRFPGRRVLISVFHTLLAMPAVVVGLTLYLLLSRSGPFGDLKLLFSQTAMMIGQIILCFPSLVAMGHSAIQAADRRAWETAVTLGAGPGRAMLTLMHEVRFGLMAALLAPPVADSPIISHCEQSDKLAVGNDLHQHRTLMRDGFPEGRPDPGRSG